MYLIAYRWHPKSHIIEANHQVTENGGMKPVLELRDVINYFIISGRNLENHPLEQLMKIINVLKNNFGKHVDQQQIIK